MAGSRPVGSPVRWQAWPGVMCLMLALAAHQAWAGGPQPLSDDTLSAVSGRDGLAFNLRGFAMDGTLTLTYTSPDDGNPSLWLGNWAMSRSDDEAHTFADPYRFNVVGRPGLSDVLVFSEPANADGLLRWQFAADWGVQANGSTANGGAVIVRDLVQRGGGFDISTPADPAVQGMAFGQRIRTDIGALIFRAQGRGDATLIDDPASPSQLAFKGIHLAGADGQPWAISDVTWQPGIFNAVTDADGRSYLHYGIAWSSRPEGAPVGSLVIDNISFKSEATGNLNLGSSRIGGIQLQYLDVKFR